MNKRPLVGPLVLPDPLPCPPELPDGLPPRRASSSSPTLTRCPTAWSMAPPTAAPRTRDAVVPGPRARHRPAIDPHPRVRCAASTATATHHLDILTASAATTAGRSAAGSTAPTRRCSRSWTDLIDARLIATRPGRKRPGRLADLVILVGQDHIYATAGQAAAGCLGFPPGCSCPAVSSPPTLYAAACAVTFIGPRRRS